MAAEMFEPVAEAVPQRAKLGRSDQQDIAATEEQPTVRQARKFVSAAGVSKQEAQEKARRQAQKAAEQEAFFDFVIKEEMQPCWPFILGQDLGTALGKTKPFFTVRRLGPTFAGHAAFCPY